MQKQNEEFIFLKEKGNKFYTDENFEKEIELLTEAMKIDNKNAILYSNSLIIFNQEDGLNSIRLDKDNIKLSILIIKGYYHAALACLEMNKFKEATSYIMQCQIENDDLSLILKTVQEKKSIYEYCEKNYKSFPFFKEFFNWINNGQLHYKKLEVKFYSDDHRGVIAKNNIIKDEIIMKIPKNLLITLEVAMETYFGNKIVCLNLLSPKHSLLTSFILQERLKIHSKWMAYINILPRKYDNFPIFYTEFEMNLLEGSPFLQVIINKKRDVEADYKTIVEFIPEFKQFSMREFCEVRMAVSSRIFAININKTKTDCFAPLADMLNHKRPRQTEWYYSDSHNCFIIKALENINKGDQVFDSYGKKCNSRFLLNYGFIVENNDVNEFPFHLELENKDPMFLFKKDILRGQVNKTFQINEFVDEPNVMDFFSFIRFKVYKGSETELMLIIKENKYYYENAKFIPISPISIENEMKVLEYIEQITFDSLSKYPTTLKEDTDLLEKDSKITNNQKNCIFMRIGEKQILNYFLDMSRFVSDLLYMNIKDIKKTCDSIFPIFNPYEIYINEIMVFLNKLP